MVQPQSHLQRSQGPHRGQGRDRQLAVEELGKSIPRLPIEAHLAHCEMGAVVDFAAQPVSLLGWIIGRGVDRHPDQETGGISDPVAGAVEPLRHP